MAATSLAVIASVTLVPQSGVPTGSHFCLVCGSLGTVDATLNVLLFVPLGFALALAGASGKRTVLAVCALSLLIEITQYLAIAGRYSTVGDVVMNTLGGALGFALARYFTSLLNPQRGVARGLVAGWSVIWLVVQTVSNFGIAVTLPRGQYYGQIARNLLHFVPFRGAVIDARVGGVPTPNTRVNNSAELRSTLLNGAQVSATVIPPGPSNGIAPIFRIVDGEGREITLVAQVEDDMVFGVRTGAEILRLRPLLFTLPNAFARTRSRSDFSSDTLRLSGQYTADKVIMEAGDGAARNEAYFVPTAALGWTFWLPFQWFVEGTRTESWISFLWSFCLAIPLGYWLLHWQRVEHAMSGTARVASTVLFSIGVLGVGLVVVPYVYGTSTAPLRDWTASISGLLAGLLLGRRAQAQT